MHVAAGALLASKWCVMAKYQLHSVVERTLNLTALLCCLCSQGQCSCLPLFSYPPNYSTAQIILVAQLR